MAHALPTSSPRPRTHACDWQSVRRKAYATDRCRESLDARPCDEEDVAECRHCGAVLCPAHGADLGFHFADCPLVLVDIHGSVAALAERIEDKRQELRRCIEQQQSASRRIEETQRLIARLGAAQRMVAASVEVTR